jgi:histidine phosphotransferase ChpT
VSGAESPDLVALVGSRIAHDLISPLGAIGNGVELLELTGLDTPELGLIADSVASANARIRLFRLAFGAARPGAQVAASEIAALTAAMSGARLGIDWPVSQDVARGPAKLGFLAIMCCETAMPRGGHIAVTTSGESWQITATAARLNPDPALWALVTHGTDAVGITPAQVHFALIGPEARAQGRRLAVEMTDTTLSVGF